MFNAKDFKNPYEAVSVADCFSKLSREAQEIIQAIFAGNVQCIADSGKIKTSTVISVISMKLNRYQVNEIISKEVNWYIKEVVLDKGDPKPITHFERRKKK